MKLNESWRLKKSFFPYKKNAEIEEELDGDRKKKLSRIKNNDEEVDNELEIELDETIDLETNYRLKENNGDESNDAEDDGDEEYEIGGVLEDDPSNEELNSSDVAEDQGLWSVSDLVDYETGVESDILD